MNNISIEFTQEEIKMLLEIINAISFQGNSIEQIYQLKLKIKSSIETKSQDDGKE